MQRAALVPRLFFQHFTDTSFVVFDEARLRAFLIGFLSQSRPEEAYIHFVGIDPGYRGRGLGADLYERFFAIVRQHRRRTVRAITSASNAGSQAFHRRMGFSVSDPIANYDEQLSRPVDLRCAADGEEATSRSEALYAKLQLELRIPHLSVKSQMGARP